jgi:ATP-dependent phosphofructokinase / diphosphate-dependent phosphofructokinase
MSERIAILTGGGDAPGLNAVIRSVVKAASRRGWETLGFLDGFEGLIEPVRYRRLDYRDLDGLLFRGGTILGTTNRGRFTARTGLGQERRVPQDILQQAKATFEALALRALVCVGGDGTLAIAQQLFDLGVPLVGIPKTIDNDLAGTEVTFGFHSAVDCAVEAIDRLHTTAQSHDRVMVLEVMGRYAGWIAVYAGLAGGADVILIPEIEFNYASILKKIDQRQAEGKEFTIIVAAEGARQLGGEYVTQSQGGQPGEARLGGIAEVITGEIQARSGKQARFVVLGYLQRGGPPSSFDRLLCTRFGVSAVNFIAEGKYGCMAALQGTDIVPVKITQAIDQTRTVPPDGELVKTCRAIGISFGCE